MPVVTDTTAIAVLAVVTVASAVRTNVLHVTVARVESVNAPLLTDYGTIVNAASRTQLPSSLSLSRQRSHTRGSLRMPAQDSAVVYFCLQIEHNVVIYFNVNST